MKINSILAVFAMAALCASCVREPVFDDGGQPSGNNGEYTDYSDEDVVRGWVRIKLADNSGPLNVGEFTRGAVDTGNPGIDDVAAQLGATEVRRVFADGGRFAARRRKSGLHLWYDLKLGDNVPVTRAEASVGTLPGVQHVQPIYKRKFASGAIVPAEYVYIPAEAAARQSLTAGELPFDDPELPKQWHYNNDGSMPYTIAGSDINLFRGWEVLGTKGDPGIIVAVIDSGVQWDHPDLADNMWVNEAELNGSKDIDDDNNGYYDDIYGACFMPKYSPHNKPGGILKPGHHGTHVAGTIAAVNGNGIGVCGVAGGTGNKDGVKIMSLQIIRDDTGDDVPLDDVFAYAADNGAVIASCSWMISRDGLSEDTRAGIDYFNANAGWDDTDGDGINDIQTGPMAGGLCIFGTGNEGTNKVYYPAKDPSVVGVGAISADYEVTWYSEYGEGVDIMAPGGDPNKSKSLQVYSTYTNGGYAYNAGTSMATPHVSGIAALILARFKGEGFTAVELRSRLERSCRPIMNMTPKYHDGVGNGMIDISLALTEVPEDGPQVPDFEAVAAPASVKITGPVPVDGNGMPVIKYNFEYAEVVDGTAVETTKEVLSNNKNAGSQFEYIFAGKSEATYKFRINAVDRYGNETEYIERETKTLIYDNHAPEIVRELSDVEIRKAGEDNMRLYTLLTYFKEPDAEYGDEITFSVVNGNDKVVRTELRNGLSLAVIPLRKGSSDITVTATDKRGASTVVDFKVTVLEGTGAGVELIRPFGNLSFPESGGFTKTYNLKSYFTAPDTGEGGTLAFTAVSTDESVVKAAVEGDALQVTALKKGSATITVTATDSAGESAVGEIAVTVTKEPGETSPDSMQLYPNPVSDYMNIRLGGSGAADVNVVLYDAAARKAMERDVTLDGSGVVRIDEVSALAPGVYTVVVTKADVRFNGTIVKK